MPNPNIQITNKHQITMTEFSNTNKIERLKLVYDFEFGIYLGFYNQDLEFLWIIGIKLMLVNILPTQFGEEPKINL